ncbi:hypothetical protein [Niabella hibiscisoli]|uniref:hypothetical protein n=1 Tax=Niabella hibiscisoli TaxID=1825928 RepID=UPI001F0D2F97|nr:hypothetical protein [Niabella hibiscisoli]MCH5718198.1 hypothetical protein [Niabella hibiscisoli]
MGGGIGWSAGARNTPGANKQNLGGSLLGASIETGSGKPSFSVGGYEASIANSNSGKISSESSGGTFDIPVWYGVNVTLGYQKTRYWSDEKSTSKTYGSYINRVMPASDYLNFNDAYDNYSSLDEGVNMYTNIESRELNSASYVDYDQYTVVSQGLSGSIRPYAFQHHLINQARVLKNAGGFQWQLYSNRNNANNHQPVFRFENDFSNTYRQNYGAQIQDLNNLPDPYSQVPASFDGTPTYGDNDGSYGFGGGNKLAGSQSIQVGAFIKPSRVDTPSTRPLLGERPGTIPGFSITNNSGVTYHYALPAYANEEESFQAWTRDRDHNFNRLTRPKAYAYTWYLTSITGPDFVDRNGNQVADPNDWGYFVNFEYGLWNENFMWRNPAEGFRQDEDPTFSGVSMGQKEIYYLNAIKTRTHTALFEKEERIDGKGVSPLAKEKDGEMILELIYSPMACLMRILRQQCG